MPHREETFIFISGYENFVSFLCRIFIKINSKRLKISRTIVNSDLGSYYTKTFKLFKKNMRLVHIVHILHRCMQTLAFLSLNFNFIRNCITSWVISMQLFLRHKYGNIYQARFYFHDTLLLMRTRHIQC